MAQQQTNYFSLFALDVEKPEGNAGTTQFIFAAVRQGDLSRSESVAYWITPSWDSGEMYSSASDAWDIAGFEYGFVSFAPSQEFALITVPVVGDTALEYDESFSVHLDPSAEGQSRGVEFQAYGTIRADDPWLSNDYERYGLSAPEGGLAPFTLTRLGTDLGAFTVDYTLIPAPSPTAPQGTLAAGTVSFASGAATATLTLTIPQDSEIEPDSWAGLFFSNPSTPIALPAWTSLIILDDDLDPATDIAATTATTGAVAFGTPVTGTIDAYGDHDWFRVTLTEGASYRFVLSPASAWNQLRIPALGLLDADGIPVMPPTTGGSWWTDAVIDFDAPATGTYYIDAASVMADTGTRGAYQLLAIRKVAVAITAETPRAAEGAAGETASFNFTVTRGSVTDGSLSLAYGISTAPRDWLHWSSLSIETVLWNGQPVDGAIAFAPGESAGTLTIAMAGNDIPSRTHGFQVSLTPMNGAMLTSTPTASALIVEDDPITSIVARLAATGEASPTAASYYEGPLNVERQFVDLTPEDLNIALADGEWLICTGAGNDAISARGPSFFAGHSIVNAGGGSNFLAMDGSIGYAVLDARGDTASSWSTIDEFGPGDAVALMGISEATHHLIWSDDDGLPGYRGLTLHAVPDAGPVQSVTFPGLTRAKLDAGAMTIQTLSEPAIGGDYLLISGLWGINIP